MTARAVCTMALVLLATGCERETRRYRELPAASSRTESVRLTQLQPGEPQPDEKMLSPYQKNAYGLAQGKTL